MAALAVGRAEDLRRGLVVEAITIAWMVIEASVAIGVGVVARSGASLAFGIDSVIELGAAGVLIWRLREEFAWSEPADVESTERRAGKIIGALLFALAAYVVI